MRVKSIKFFILFLFMSPVLVEAQIVITEIMYNLEGTDSGFEWIEIKNKGNDPVDLTNWKLFENDTNHRINPSIEEGSLVMSSGSYAVIADNIEKFNQNNPNFNGLLFDSAFSLSNSGETFIIRNLDLIDIDNASYIPENGANGDGNSLQLINGDWIPAFPSPGYLNSSYQESVVENNNNNMSEPTLTVSKEVELMRQNILVDAGKDRKVVVGADTLFKAFAVGKENLPLKNARYVWSMGDGSKKEGQSVLYTYKYPGDYVVILSVTSSDYSANDRIIIEALPADVIISKVDFSAGFIELYNQSDYELNLSWWHLVSGNQDFGFPENTIILPNKRLKFPSVITGLDLNNTNQIKLLYPNGEVVDDYSGDFVEKIISPIKNVKNTQTYSAPKEEIIAEIKEEEVPLGKNKDHLAFVADSDEKKNNLFNKWTFSLGGIMLFSIASALFVGKIEDHKDVDEDELTPEDFTIIE